MPAEIKQGRIIGAPIVGGMRDFTGFAHLSDMGNTLTN